MATRDQCLCLTLLQERLRSSNVLKMFAVLKFHVNDYHNTGKLCSGELHWRGLTICRQLLQGKKYLFHEVGITDKRKSSQVPARLLGFTVLIKELSWLNWELGNIPEQSSNITERTNNLSLNVGDAQLKLEWVSQLCYDCWSRGHSHEYLYVKYTPTKRH